MQNDPGQNIDISNEKPEIAKKLILAKEKWENEVLSELPKPMSELSRLVILITNSPRFQHATEKHTEILNAQTAIQIVHFLPTG